MSFMIVVFKILVIIRFPENVNTKLRVLLQYYKQIVS